jgi:predicted nucleic acid-binding Zn ribbon protein
MPIYEYRCANCERSFEAFVRSGDDGAAAVAAAMANSGASSGGGFSGGGCCGGGCGCR